MTDTGSTAALQSLLAGIDDDRLTAELAAMVSLPSVNPFGDAPDPRRRELEFADHFAAALASAGLTVEVDEVAPGRCNVVGRLAGTGGGRSVLLAGHLDTVGVEGYDAPFEPRLEAGRLYGRGSCDMKAALAAYVEVARVLRDSGVRLRGDLVIAGICDEEHAMIGSRRLGAAPPLADVAIVGEPTGLEVCPAHKGQVCVVIRTLGTAVHSSMPELGDNAIVAMATVIGRLEKYGRELLSAPAHPLCGTARVSAGVISGGTIASTVPDRCELEIDRRTLPGESTEQVLAELGALLDIALPTGGQLRYELTAPTLVCEALDTSMDDPVVVSLLGATGLVLGRASAPVAFAAATDAPNLGMPAVVCGPGRLEQAHTVDEYVELSEVRDAVEIYLRAVVDITS